MTSLRDQSSQVKTAPEVPRPGQPKSVLTLLILASGETRDILRLPSASSPIRATTVDWTPDSRAVVFY